MAKRETPLEKTGASGKPVRKTFEAEIENSFGKSEWNAAFADLWTFIAFILAFLAVPGVNPAGIFFAFGLALVVSGWWFRAPLPVQPMKAIGAGIATLPWATAATLAGASLTTGAFWMLVSATGLSGKISKWVPKSVVAGISVGLAFALASQALRLITFDPYGAMDAVGSFRILEKLGVIGLVGAVVIPAVAYGISKYAKFPFILSLLALATGYAAFVSPVEFGLVYSTPVAFRMPEFGIGEITFSDFTYGAIFLALPQFPVTLGNAVVSVTREMNRLYPRAEITENTMMKTTGWMNVLSGCFGGIPMCHGSGGVAAYSAFWAKTWGATVIFGGTLIVASLFFSAHLKAYFAAFPSGVAGALLLFAAYQLVMGSKSAFSDKDDFAPFALTALLSCWNAGVGLVAGIAFAKYLERKNRSAAL